MPPKQNLPYEPDWVNLSRLEAEKHREKEHKNTSAGIFVAILILAIISLRIDSLILSFQHDAALRLLPMLASLPESPKNSVKVITQIINFYFETIVVWLSYKYIFNNMLLLTKSKIAILKSKVSPRIIQFNKKHPELSKKTTEGFQRISNCFLKILVPIIICCYLIFPLFFRPSGLWEEVVAHIIRLGCLGIVYFWYYTFKSDLHSNSKINEESAPDILSYVGELAIYRREENTIKAIKKK